MTTSLVDLLARVIRAVTYQIRGPILRLRSPTLTALVCAALATTYRRPHRYRVLVVSKDVLGDDIRALSKFGEKIQYSMFGAGLLKGIFVIATRGHAKGIDTVNYYEPGRWDEARRLYYEFLQKMLPKLIRLMKIDAVMAASWTYVSHQELARVLREIGTPFVVLYKEGGGLVPGRVSQQRDFASRMFFNGPVLASRILTYHDMVGDRIHQMGLESLTRDQIRAVGTPRMDFYRAFPSVPSDQMTITFFAFSPQSAFYYFEEMNADDGDPNLAENLKRRAKAIYEEILKYASNNPHIKLVIKKKKGTNALRFATETLSALMGDCEASSRYPNVTILDDWSARDLIRRSTVVIAINSTTMIEALLAGKHVLVPDFGDFFGESSWNLFHNYPILVSAFRSTEGLERAIQAGPPSGPEFEAAREQFLRDYLTTGRDEFSTPIVEKNLIELIEGRDG